MAHLVIDIVKVYSLTENTRRRFFFYDQAIHLFLILGIWLAYEKDIFPIQNLYFDQLIVFITAVYALTTPTSIAIKFFISKWTPLTVTDDNGSLQEAGKTIGIIERLFVFVFVVSGHWEAIGFLLAAKSIFRFGDLKESKERNLTEYVLIGTLVSFGIALLVGMSYNKLLQGNLFIP